MLHTDMPITQQLELFREGELTENQTIAMFQDLVSSNLAWSMPSSYQEAAYALIEHGRVHPTLQ